MGFRRRAGGQTASILPPEKLAKFAGIKKQTAPAKGGGRLKTYLRIQFFTNHLPSYRRLRLISTPNPPTVSRQMVAGSGTHVTRMSSR